MIKIGFDAKQLFKDSSGLGNYSRSTVELLTKYHPDNKYYLFSAHDENRVGFATPKGTKIITPKGILGDILPSVWNSFSMSKDIRKNKINIFHGLANQLPSDIRMSGATSVVTIHDLIFIRYPNLYSKMERSYFEWKYRNSCSSADMVIAISEQTKQDLIEFWNIPTERISVVYQGCNPLYLTKASAAAQKRVRARYNLPENYIVSVGTIEERKNLMLTLHALHDGGLDIPLVACGRWTPYVDKLKEYIASKGMEDQVIFIHDCHLEELPAIYQMASVSVYVSLFEGFGIPILESLNSGTPVITSRGGVFRETGGDAALYIGQYDLDEMIENLKMILTNDQKRDELITKGYNHAAKFTDQNIADNIMAVYHKII